MYAKVIPANTPKHVWQSTWEIVHTSIKERKMQRTESATPDPESLNSQIQSHLSKLVKTQNLNWQNERAKEFISNILRADFKEKCEKKVAHRSV